MRPIRPRAIVLAGALLAALAAVLFLARREPPPERPATGTGGGPPARTGPSWLPWRSADRGPAGPAEAPADPPVPVEVRVVDLDGRPVEGATVEARIDAEPDDLPAATTSGRTDRDGRFLATLPPEVDVVFLARDDRGREGISPLVSLDPAAAADAEGGSPPAARVRVQVELAERGAIAGTVVDPRGSPVAGARVAVSSWSSLGVDDESLIAGDPEVETDARGAFRIELRVMGAFNVEVEATSFRTATERAVQVLPGRETPLRIALEPAYVIRGRVVDAAGGPVAGARVAAQAVGGDGISTAEDTSGDLGEFEIGGLPSTPHVVTATAPTFRPAEAWEVVAGGPPVTIRMTRGGSLRGTLRVDLAAVGAMPDADGDDEAGDSLPIIADLYLSTPEDRAPEGGIALATGVPRGREAKSPSGTVDPRGRYVGQIDLVERESGREGYGEIEADGLPPTTYRVTILIGNAMAQFDGVRIVEGGVARLDVALPDRRRSGRIAGTVRTDDGRTIAEGTVYLYGAAPSGLSADLDPSGRFLFPSVPPGEYLLHASVEIDGGDLGDEPILAYTAPKTVAIDGETVAVELTASTGSPGPLGALADGEGPFVEHDGEGWELPDGGDGEPLSDDGVSEWAEPGEELDRWYPELLVEEIDDRLVVTHSAPAADGRRLFGGDRVLSIDGVDVTPLPSWEALERLGGAKGSICTLVVERPATRETITAGLPRTQEDDWDGE